MRRRATAFVVVSGAVALLGAGYVGVALLTTPGPDAARARVAAADPALRAVLARPHLVFLEPSGGDPTQHRLAVTPLDAPDQRVYVGAHCSRTYAAGGRAMCLGEDQAGAGHLMDAALLPTREFSQPGLPSRVRVSADGRWGATTVFVFGHSYATVGFSTQTLLHDLATGATVDLERFTVTRDGQRLESPDFNFWGVTFAGGDRFYATLGTGDHAYLIEGDIARRSARVLRDGVECPSLSPDGTRIVYKARVAGQGPRQWRLHLLDLRTMTDRPLAETRSVDDQAEWLDDRTVLYGLDQEKVLGTDLWALPVDGSAPSLFLRQAASPAVSQAVAH